jgi:predicted transcriptional regulator
MAGERQRLSRVFTISFPPELAKQVDRIAKEESRNVSELFREAFRSYSRERIRLRLREDVEYARTRNPEGFTPEDVERLVSEARSRKRPEKKTGR